jgi:ferredoxin
MKVAVDASMCDMHLQCVVAAPEIFAVTDQGELSWPESVSTALAGKARAAAAICPAAAIELDE